MAEVCGDFVFARAGLHWLLVCENILLRLFLIAIYRGRVENGEGQKERWSSFWSKNVDDDEASARVVAAFRVAP